MPPANTDALGQKKYDFVSPALDHLQIPAAGAGPSAAAGFSSSGKGNERVPDVDTGPTLEEQQRRFQTASVIGDWEISAWYSVAGRESIPQTRLRFMKSLIKPNKALIEDEEWADIYDGEEVRKIAEGSSKEPKAATIQEPKGSGHRKRKHQSQVSQ